MPRGVKILIIVVLVLLLFTFGKWLVIDSLIDDQPSGRYRDTGTGMQRDTRAIDHPGVVGHS